jgi:membrane protein implicated in regulation of membrane protease activity
MAGEIKYKDMQAANLGNDHLIAMQDLNGDTWYVTTLFAIRADFIAELLSSDRTALGRWTFNDSPFVPDAMQDTEAASYKQVKAKLNTPTKIQGGGVMFYDGTEWRADAQPKIVANQQLETSLLRVMENIHFPNVTSGYENFTLQMTNEGMIKLVNIPRQKIEQVEANTSDVALTTSATTINQFPLDFEVDTSNTSFVYSAKASNNNNSTETITFQTTIDSVLVSEKIVEIPRGAEDYQIGFSGYVGANYAAGMEVVITATASNSNMQLKGSVSASMIKIQKDVSSAALITKIIDTIKDFDQAELVKFYSGTFGTSITLTEITSLVPIPIKGATYMLRDSGSRAFRCTYDGTDWFYERLSKAS